MHNTKLVSQQIHQQSTYRGFAWPCWLQDCPQRDCLRISRGGAVGRDDIAQLLRGLRPRDCAMNPYLSAYSWILRAAEEMWELA